MPTRKSGPLRDSNHKVPIQHLRRLTSIRQRRSTKKAAHVDTCAAFFVLRRCLCVMNTLHPSCTTKPIQSVMKKEMEEEKRRRTRGVQGTKTKKCSHVTFWFCDTEILAFHELFLPNSSLLRSRLNWAWLVAPDVITRNSPPKIPSRQIHWLVSALLF